MVTMEIRKGEYGDRLNSYMCSVVVMCEADIRMTEGERKKKFIV